MFNFAHKARPSLAMHTECAAEDTPGGLRTREAPRGDAEARRASERREKIRARMPCVKKKKCEFTLTKIKRDNEG